jgi:hypothetical protein
MTVNELFCVRYRSFIVNREKITPRADMAFRIQNVCAVILHRDDPDRGTFRLERRSEILFRL